MNYSSVLFAESDKSYKYAYNCMKEKWQVEREDEIWCLSLASFLISNFYINVEQDWRE